MIPFHSILPDLAQREMRCVQVGPAPEGGPDPGLPPDDYAFLEFYCEDLNCDCRRVFLQVIAKSQPDRVLANIGYGWENERFYRRKMPWNPDEARGTVRGELDPLHEQSEFAENFLDLFKHVVLDEPYRLRLRRHYRLFRAELERRAAAEKSGNGNAPVADPSPPPDAKPMEQL
jgi:hypothetical protein